MTHHTYADGVAPGEGMPCSPLLTRIRESVIGDDTLMEQAGRRPVEAAFTHGSSAQRMKWLRIGLETGNEDKCDTFADLRN